MLLALYSYQFGKPKKVKKIKARCWAHVRLFLLLKYYRLNVKPVIRDREKNTHAPFQRVKCPSSHLGIST